MTATITLDELTAIDWTADDGSTVHSYDAEGHSTTAGWFCFEVDTLDSLRDELDSLVVDVDAVLADHQIA